MTDDFSEIDQNATCYTLNSATSIYSYGDYIRYSYTQIGGKWYKTGQTSYVNLPVNTLCRTYDDITAISSKAEFAPVYAGFAFALVFVTLGLFWATIRKITIWKI